MAKQQASSASSLRLEALRFMVRPLVRFCLRSSYALQDLVTVAKEIFVELAQDELKGRADKVNVSRVSVLTGIRRAEVQRLLETPESEPQDRSAHFLIRVIGQWRNDREFYSSPGEPKPLTFSGEKAQFRRLCAKVSASINPGTIQYELESRGFVERQDDKLVLTYRQLPLASFPREGLAVLSSDMNDLIEAVEENLFRPSPITNLHLRTEFDNIEPRYVPTIRQWFLDEGVEFHRKARNFLAQFDRDLNPELAGSTKNSQPGARVSVSAHALTPVPTAQKDSVK